MCSEGQVGHLYKYNGLSPRMFHTAWHFHYLKLHRHSALSNLPQIYMWLNATHAPDCQEAPNDISVRADDREDEAPAGSGDVHEWKECIPRWLGWPYAVGWTKERIQTPIPSRLDAFASHRMRHSQKSTWFHPNLPPRINQRHTFICLHQARLRAIIAAVPENNLTWLCVSMATGPMSVAVSPLPVYICNYQQRLQRRDWRNERKRRFSSTRWFKMWSCSITGYFY